MGDHPIPKNGIYTSSDESAASEKIPDNPEVELEMSRVEADLKNSIEKFQETVIPEQNITPTDQMNAIEIDEYLHDDTDGSEEVQLSIGYPSGEEITGQVPPNMGRDFNEILTLILGNIRIARSKWFNGEDIVSTLDHAEESVYRAKDLTGKLMSSTNIDTGNPGFDIGDLLENLLPMIFDPSRSNCKLDIRRDALRVGGDPDDLGRALMNILMNVKSGLHPDEVIFISASDLLIEEGWGDQLKNGRYVRISVHDRERDLDDDKEYIRAPVFSRKAKWRGLDFPAAQDIVEKYGGRIIVDSHRDEGLGIQIYLPALDTTSPINSHMKPKERGSGRVLIMEYEGTFLKTIGYLLNRQGYDVVTVINGEEGIRIYIDSMEKAKPFNLIIIDLVEFDRNDGLEMMRQITRIDPDAIGILASGCNSGPILEDYRKFGFKGCIMKPFEIDDLIRLIDSVSAVS